MKESGTIVMAVHRPDPVLLARQVESIQSQTEGEWTCLIGIDGHDKSVEGLCRGLVSGDDRFSIKTFQENVGHYRHFERLLALVPPRSPWFALCDQDDRWHPTKLSQLLELLASDDVVGAVGQAVVTDRDGRAIGSTAREVPRLPGELLKNQVTGAFFMARSELLAVALPFPQPTAVARHDHWLGVVAAARGRIAVAGRALQDYVQHEGNAIGETDLVHSAHRVSLRGASLTEQFDDLALDVWGWRVAMAETLLGRGVELAPDDRHLLGAVAQGRMSLRLFRSLATQVLCSRLNPRVAAGMAAASLWWPLAKRRSRRVRHCGDRR